MAKAGAKEDSRFDYERGVDGRQKKVLGRGNFGTVFAALDHNNGDEKIAVKEVYNVKNVQESVREIKRHCQLGHRNIIRYIDCLYSNGTIKIFMERVLGDNLADLLRHEWGPLSASGFHLKNLTKQIADGLAYLHQDGIIHGNLQPRNILICTLTQTLKLSNFGRYLEVRSDVQTKTPESDIYMAPEVVNPMRVTQPADIWSVGCVVIAMITGCPPEKCTVTESAAALGAKRRCHLFIPDNLPKDVHSLIQRCVKEDHRQRPTALEISKDRYLVHDTPIVQELSSSRRLVHTYDAPHDVLLDGTTFRPAEGHLPYNGQSYICIDKSLTVKTGRTLDCEKTPARIMQQIIPEIVTSGKEIELLLEYSKFKHNNHVRRQALKSILYIFDRTITSCHLSHNNTNFFIIEKELFSDNPNDSFSVEDHRLKTYVMVAAILYIRRTFAAPGEPVFEITDTGKPTMIEKVLKKMEVLIKNNPSNYTWTTMYKFLKKLESRFASDSKRQKTKQLFVSFLQFVEAARECVSQEDIKAKEKQVIKHLRSMPWLERHLLLHYIVSKVCSPDIWQTSCRQQLIELFQKIVREISVNVPEYAISVVHAYVKLLSRFASAEGSELVLDDNPPRKGMGFKRFMETAVNRLDQNIFLDVLAPLCFHPYSDVHSTVIDFAVPPQTTKRSKKKQPNCSNKLLQCQSKYIAQILEPFQFQHKDETVHCQQGDCDRSPCHDIWKGTFGTNISTQMFIARPDPQKRSQDDDILKNEIAILQQLSKDHHNPNIIRLLVYQTQLDPVFYVVDDVGMSMSLKVFLMDKIANIRPKLELVDLVRHAILPMLKAVRFCHDKNILLRNITTFSFVMKQAGSHGSGVAPFTIMLNSFHMAVRSTAEGSPYEKSKLIFYGNKQDRIPVLWSAPEVLLECFHTEFSEVYMIGHTVLEILTNGDPPYSELQNLNEDEKVLEILRYGIRPTKPFHVPDRVFSLALECLEQVPEKRLSLEQLEGELEEFAQISTDDQVPVTGPQKSPSSSNRRPLRKYNEIPPFMINVRRIKDLNKLSYTVPKRETVKFTQDELKAQDDPVLVKEKELRSHLLCNIEGKHWTVLKELEHKNIASVSNIMSINKTPCLVTILNTGTKLNLLKHSLKSTCDEITVDDLLSYICQIAEGMKYLHSLNLLHCCLQAKFVYLSADKSQVEIGHLGRTTLVELGPYDVDAQSARITPFLHIAVQKLHNMTRYSPREVNENGCYSMRSDVASFGYLIYEVFEARSFHPKTQHVKVVPYAHAKREEVLMEQRRRYEIQQPTDCPIWLFSIVKMCIHELVSFRPLFPALCKILRRKLDTSSLDDDPDYLTLDDISKATASESGISLDDMGGVRQSGRSSLSSMAVQDREYPDPDYEILPHD